MPLLFSIIIPTRHRNNFLAMCLDRLAPGKQSLLAEYYEVIVTDDGTVTTSAELLTLHYPWVKWYQGPRKGPAANRNNGATYAQGEWLVFTDDDCLPEAGWLEAYQEAIRSYNHISVFEGRTFVDRPRRSIAEVAPVNEHGGCLWSCNFLVKKQVFVGLNGFDEDFPFATMEDIDFYLRVSAVHQILFVPAAAVCHPWRNKKITVPDKEKLYSLQVFLAKHPDKKSVFTASHFFKIFCRNTIDELLVGSIRYGGKGIRVALCNRINELFERIAS